MLMLETAMVAVIYHLYEQDHIIESRNMIFGFHLAQISLVILIAAGLKYGTKNLIEGLLQFSAVLAAVILFYQIIAIVRTDIENFINGPLIFGVVSAVIVAIKGTQQLNKADKIYHQVYGIFRIPAILISFGMFIRTLI